MKTTEPELTERTAEEVTWDLDTLLPEGETATDLVARADELAVRFEANRGLLATADAARLAEMLAQLEVLNELVSRAGHWVMLRFSEDTLDPERGAALAAIEETTTAVGTKLIFFDLEWAELKDDKVDELLADPQLDRYAHHLRNLRKNRPHLLEEAEETIMAEKSTTGASAWVRLFEELVSTIEVSIDGEDHSLEYGLSKLQDSDREVRRKASEAVSAGLEPDLRTRAFIFNTLLADKSTDDRLRHFDTWVSSRNLGNEATDESVQALVDAVVSRYDIPQRWYKLKAKVLGLDRLADFDRGASVADASEVITWSTAERTVRDAYASFSDELSGVVNSFFDDEWIDAGIRPGKRPGAFCAYSVPTHHPYVFLNFTGTNRDILTLAHELGHGVHAYLAREQGIFHHSTPLTLAETASVFGETVTNNRLLDLIDDPHERFALLAATLEDSIATVFRQVAMNRFEDAVHTARRDEGELSVEAFGDFWHKTQAEMLGDAVEITDGYRNWWSYVPHFIATPGYVYAYAYGQLLALSVYARYEAQGDPFVPAYLDLLRAGGSMSPEDLGRIVDCDLTDPQFWDAGLNIVEAQLGRAEDAAREAGRL